MKRTELSFLIVSGIVFYCLPVVAHAAIDQTNFVAPTAASPYRPQKSQHRAILPYSLYKRRLEEQNRLKGQVKLTSTATHGEYSVNKPQDNSDRALTIYLPAFKNANLSQIAEKEADAVESRKAMLKRLNSTADESDNAEVVSSSYDLSSQERLTYSTSNTRQPLPYHKSIFRPKTNQIVTVNEPRFQTHQNNRNSIIKYNPKPMTEKLSEAPVPARPVDSALRETPFVNGVSLEKSAIGLNSNLHTLQTNPDSSDQPYQLRPVYTNLAPAPYNTLSSDTSSQNLIESIFSQSQTPVRFSPGNTQQLAGLVQPVASQSSSNPLQALANTANSLGGSEMLNQFLGGGGSPLEQISKLARNLLSLPSGNPELLSALTKSLTTNTVAEGSKLTSNAVIQPASAANALVSSADKAGLAVSAADTLFSSAKDEENSNATMKILNNLPDDQRTLLAAAIQNGEIDSSNLTPTLSLVKDKNILKSGSRLMEWIQQNRPRAADRESSEKASVVSADKLPYYGRYCGSFVEQANSTRHYNIAGALWAVEERRLIVSKFHFKPGSRMENVTFWAGPANETGTAMDAFPSDNGFYLQPQPVDLNIFINQRIEVITAKIRPQEQKDEAIVTAEVEELEDDQVKNFSVNEFKRSRREVKAASSVPLHFKASTNDTDKSVHLTSPLIETTPPIALVNDDQSHILVSATKNEVSFGKEPESANELSNSSQTLIPLDWYAGFQPLLLTLPEGRSVRTLHWLSIYDHKRKESAAVVLMPNGIAFQIPAAVQLRPLTANGFYKVSSGVIKVLNMKTIEIEDFSLETNGMPVWFMVGKEIVPHAEGQIVPVFDKETKTFDCDSLRDYKNKTITLRLPGTLDIKDVFWFSVFSITKGVSLSHLYIPFNDMKIPTDLLGISTPRCVWKTKL